MRKCSGEDFEASTGSVVLAKSPKSRVLARRRLILINTTNLLGYPRQPPLIKSEKLSEKNVSRNILIREVILKNSNSFLMHIKSFAILRKGNYMMTTGRKESKTGGLRVEEEALEGSSICLEAGEGSKVDLGRANPN